MRLTSSIVWLVALVALPLYAATPNSSSDRVERAKSMLAARLAYAASADYDPYNSDVSKNTSQAAKLLDEGKFKEAVEEADRGLNHDRFNIDLLVIKAAAQRESGDTQHADETRQEWTAVVDSILRTDNGKTFETAYRVITVSEEYGVLRVLHLHHTNQSLVGHERSQYDVFTVQDAKTGVERTVYFNIDLPKGWLDRKFSKTGVGGKP